MAYFQAIERFFLGVTPYQPGSYWSFIYPPGFLILFFWLKFIPWSFLSYIWPAVSLLCLWWVVSVMMAGVRFYLKGMVFIFFLNWFPVKFTLGMGQINLITLALFILFFRALLKQRNIWAGVILGILITIKITPVLFLLWLLRLKKWRITLVSLLSLLVINLAVLIKLPMEVFRQFLLITKGGLLASSTYYFNQSWVAALDRFFPGGEIFGRIVVVVIFLTVVYKLKKFNLKNFSLMLLLVTMVSPVAWQHHLVALIPAIIYLIKEGRKLFWTITGTLLVGFNLANPALWPTGSLIYSHAAVGATILFILLLMAKDKDGYLRPHG